MCFFMLRYFLTFNELTSLTSANFSFFSEVVIENDIWETGKLKQLGISPRFSLRCYECIAIMTGRFLATCICSCLALT